MASNTGRLDRIICEIERLQGDANEIIDAHVNCLLRELPPAASFGVTKCQILEPAGQSLHYVNALKLVRDNIAARIRSPQASSSHNYASAIQQGA